MSEHIEIHDGEAIAFVPQCTNCKNYLGDFKCKIHGEIDFKVLGNEKICPECTTTAKSIKDMDLNDEP